MHSGAKQSSGLVTTKAVVLSSLKYGEADLIVNCFTQSNGLKAYLLRNILKSKKGKLRASQFQVLTQLEIVARHKNKSTLDYIREAKIYFPYKDLQQDIFKTSIALFLAEVLRNVIQEEETDGALFLFLEESFRWLDQATEVSNFHLLFLIRLTQYLGFYPFHSQKRFFNMLEGIFQDEEGDKHCLGVEKSAYLKQCLKLNYAENSHLKFNRETRNDFLDTLLLYYELHVQGFRRPRSLDVLQQLFS